MCVKKGLTVTDAVCDSFTHGSQASLSWLWLDHVILSPRSFNIMRECPITYVSDISEHSSLIVKLIYRPLSVLLDERKPVLRVSRTSMVIRIRRYTVQ